MFELLTDQGFLNALAVMIGPLAFFAAPTEEIEHLLLGADMAFEEIETVVPALIDTPACAAKAA